MNFKVKDYKGRDRNIKSFEGEVGRIVEVEGVHGRKIMFVDAWDSDPVIENRYRQKFGGRKSWS